MGMRYSCAGGVTVICAVLSLFAHPDNLSTAMDALHRYQEAIARLEQSALTAKISIAIYYNDSSDAHSREAAILRAYRSGDRCDIEVAREVLDRSGATDFKPRPIRAIAADESFEYSGPNEKGRYQASYWPQGESRLGATLAMLKGAEAVFGHFRVDHLSVFDIAEQSKNMTASESREAVDGSDCIVVRMESINGVYTLWLDPNADYLPRKVLVNKDASSIFNEDVHVADLKHSFGGHKNITPEGVETLFDHVLISQIDGKNVITGFDISEKWRYASDITRTIVRNVSVESVQFDPDFGALGAFVPQLPDGTALKVQEPTNGVEIMQWQGEKVVPYTAPTDIDANKNLVPRSDLPRRLLNK